MKRMLGVLTGCLLLLSLACCRSPIEFVSETKDLIRVGFSQTGTESVWRVTNTNSIKEALSEENGYELIYSDAQQKQENQIRAIRKFIQQRVDYIVLAPIMETGWDSVLEEARKANIPVIIEDRMISVQDDSLYAAYIGSNFLMEGKKATGWLSSELERQNRDQAPINIVHIQGTLRSSAQIGRTSALEAAAANHKNWVITVQESGDFIKPKAYEIMKKILVKTRDIDVVYCENDSEAFGAITALQEAGLKCNVDDGVIIITFDATAEGLSQCLSGTISLNVECNPLQGPYIANIIQGLRQGKDVAKKTYVEETAFDCFSITQDIINKRSY